MHGVWNDESWYALFVMTGDEDNVKERLEYRFHNGMRILVPKRKLRERRGGKWSYVTRSLLPGYVLVHGKIDIETYYNFKNIPGLLKILKTGDYLSRIDPNDMSVISKLTYNSDIIGVSNVFVENGRVQVVDGPLLSLEGIIVNIDHRKGRARIKLSFLGDERTIELGINVLRPTG